VSDYLTEEEQLARLRNWWQRNGVALLIGLVLAVAGIVGWRWYQGQVEERILTASDLYQAFVEAEGDARDALATRIVEESPGTAYPSFVLFEQAKAAVQAEDAQRAQALLRRAVEVASGEELADTARLRLARVLFDADQAAEELAELGAIRGSGFRPLAAELMGDIHLDRGVRSLAHQSYVAAKEQLPVGDERPVLEMKIADTADASDS
jgi:predicted negative regulator of RcsB-dependent stress response